MNSFTITSKITGKIYNAVQADEIPDAWLVDYGNDYGYVHKDKLFLGFTLVHEEEPETARQEAFKQYCKDNLLAYCGGDYEDGWEDGWDEAQRLGNFK